MILLFFESSIVGVKITRTFASGKWTFLLSSPLLPNSQTKQSIKRLRGLFPVEHFAQCSMKCAKKGGFSPFCVIIFYIPFCWAVFHKCSTECHFMFHNDYQPIKKPDCATKFRGTLCSTPYFSMFHGMFHETHCAIKWSSLFPVSWYLYYIMFTRAQNIVETCHWRVFRLPTWVFSRRQNLTSLHGLSPIIWLSNHQRNTDTLQAESPARSQPRARRSRHPGSKVIHKKVYALKEQQHGHTKIGSRGKAQR